MPKGRKVVRPRALGIMWFSFWKPKDRLSLDELRFLIDQLTKVHIVNEDFVVEALRSIAQLITYGDQHDTAYFELFMEKQVIGEFVRLLRASQTSVVSLQLLQTMSIVVQNLKSEQSIYYMFCNEHVNSLITYAFDFRNEELLSYYITFLRAISGKLNKDTMSLLVKTQNDEVVSFPLYLEAIQFASHEDSMIRTAVRALTLNVYHVGDNAVNRFLSRAPHSDYFVNLVNIFREQCINLNEVVSNASKNLGVQSTSFILSVVDEIEDSVYYFNDIVSAGIPDVGRLIMHTILTLVIFPLLLPSMRIGAVSEPRLGAVTSVYLLCCILRIVKIKDLANTVAAALLCRTETFIQTFEAISTGNVIGHDSKNAVLQSSEDSHLCSESDAGSLETIAMIPSFSNYRSPNGIMTQNYGDIQLTPREALLSFVNCGNDVQVYGSLNVLATLFQTKELGESMADAIGLLPQRKQPKKFLEALVGEDSVEEQIVSSQNTEVKGGIRGELDIYLQRLKVYYGVPCASADVGVSPRVHRLQVLDALVSLVCRSNISAQILWDGGWLLRQLLPYSEAEFNSHHLRLLKEHMKCIRLHLRIRPSSFPLSENNLNGSVKPEILLDGRWTLAFRDQETCKHALDMTLQQVELQCNVVERSLRLLFELDPTSDNSSPRQVDNDSS